jgi:hypothetical protein
MPRMEPIGASAHRILRTVLAAQPPGPARAVFAWKIAAGPALARATDASWREDGTLVVRARNEAWLRELRRARPLLAERMRGLLGDDSVRRLVIEQDPVDKRGRDA